MVILQALERLRDNADQEVMRRLLHNGDKRHQNLPLDRENINV